MLKMVMTTELRQAIELLQLSTYELFQFIQEKAEENPFIELVEKEEVTSDFTNRVRSQATNQDFDPIANATRQEKSMYDELMEQLIDKSLDEQEATIIHFLILNMDEDGFASIKDEVVCEHLQVNQAAVAAARDVVTTLEPCGIGARDLRESLLLQARQCYPEDDLLLVIISEHLDALANKQWSELAKKVDCSLQEIQLTFEKVQTLCPRPAMKFAPSSVEYIQPDMTIKYDHEKAVHTIQLHEHYIPHVHFNHPYSAQMKNATGLSQYVQQQYQQFEWLQKSIQQRRETILKIMDVIVHHQQHFLQKGLRFLKPLTLKEVAEKIDMHESTVSRATTNKIVQTPTGIYELRHLFSTGIKSNDESTSSQTEVKEIIKEIIQGENKYRPLSDQKIVEQLKATNQISISRRTVAKYRDELLIPASSKRKIIKL